MPDTTPRLSLPILSAGQAQKEVTHNEALTLADLAVQCVVQSATLSSPPSTPAVGECWIVGPSPAGAWTGHATHIAGWTSGGWRFLVPFAGFGAWVAATGRSVRHDGSAWVDGRIDCLSVFSNGQQVLSSRQPAISGPSGGTAIDSEARAVLEQLLSMLRTHGLIAS